MVDFNAHSTLWDDCNDESRMVIEELTESENLECPNDGNSTRVNIRFKISYKHHTSFRLIGRY